MGYILYIQTPTIQQLNVGEVNTGGMLIPLQGFFFGKGVPLPQLLLTYKGDSDTDLFKIHHAFSISDRFIKNQLLGMLSFICFF